MKKIPPAAGCRLKISQYILKQLRTTLDNVSKTKMKRIDPAIRYNSDVFPTTKVFLDDNVRGHVTQSRSRCSFH